MADVNRGNRPLSPHLQVYRLPLAAVTSIMTRITGHALVAGIVLIVWWLVAAVTSPGAFACADWVVRSWLGFIILTGAILWLDAVLALPLVFSFVWLIQTRFIRDEETRLTEAFGPEFDLWAARTRRWLGRK